MSQSGMEKLYYSIGEVSETVGYEPHVLRYWEQEFEVLDPRKNRAGRRIYTEEDIETIDRIRRLLKEEKYTIEGARQAIRRKDAERAVRSDVRGRLQSLRSFLVDLRDNIEASSDV